MKFVYRFLLFFAVAFLCLSIGLIVGVKNVETIKAADIFLTYDSTPPAELVMEAVQSNEVEVFKPVLVKDDTLYILEEYDIAEGSTQRVELDMPLNYIGKDRDSVGELVERYNQSPSQKDVLNQFVSQTLVSFSADKIIVRKSYNLPLYDVDGMKQELPAVGFYVTVIGDEVVSYEADKRTVYSRPGILLSDLPEAAQDQLKDWLYFETQELLEEYLRGLGNLMESLTS